MRTKRIRGTTLVALAMSVALVVAAPAQASPQYEPNDGIHQAFGPLEAGNDYEAHLGTASDEDWYVIYVSGPGVLKLELTNDCAACDGWSGWDIMMHLRDEDGEQLNSKSVSPKATGSIEYTTPGAGTYYVTVSGNAADDHGRSYRLKATGPLTGGPRPGPVDETTPNNNMDMTTAYGPLMGGRLYGGGIDADMEEDWFVFYTAGPGAIDVAVTNTCVTCDGWSGWQIGISLLDETGASLSTNSVSPKRIRHLRYTAPGPGKYYLRMRSGGNGTKYQFVITPADLITTVAPRKASGATTVCKKSRAKRKRAVKGLKGAQKKLKAVRAKNRKVRSARVLRKRLKQQRRLARGVNKRKKALRVANKQVKRYCA